MNGNFFVADTLRPSIKDDTAHVVYSSNVVEHIVSPERMVDEIIRVLGKGGICVLRGPSFHYWKLAIFPKYLYCKLRRKKFNLHGVDFTKLNGYLTSKNAEIMYVRILPESVIHKPPFLLYHVLFSIFGPVRFILKRLRLYRYNYLNVIVFKKLYRINAFYLIFQVVQPTPLTSTPGPTLCMLSYS